MTGSVTVVNGTDQIQPGVVQTMGRSPGYEAVFISRRVQGSLNFGNPVLTVVGNTYMASGGRTYSGEPGPCTVSEAGRCVGQPDGFFMPCSGAGCDQCVIRVSGGGGVLGCTEFDLRDPASQPEQWWGRYLEVGNGNYFVGANCPTGVITLPTDASPGWGAWSWNSHRASGGVWEVCFA
jgi:hypothetical protein